MGPPGCPAAHPVRLPTDRRSGIPALFLGLQIVLVALGPFLVMAPRAQAAVLIVPMASADRNATLLWAMTAGAKPVGPGPFAGSYVVEGSYGALVPLALFHGALVIDARFSGCGAARRGDT